MFLDQLLSFDVDTSYSLPTQLSDGFLIKSRNIHERSTVPGPVGILPLDHFIYIIIGVLVFLCCSFSLWSIFKTIKSPRTYFEAIRSEAATNVASPFREKKAPPPGRVSAMARGEVGKLRAQPIYQADGFLEPSLMAKPNLPLPVVREIAEPEQPGAGMEAVDIEAWGALVKEKESLNITIANLERVAEVRKQTGEFGAMNPRLLTALQRRAEVENSINAAYEKFKQRRGEWSTDEWQVVELIMKYSPR
jgi:hypothetical protein